MLGFRCWLHGESVRYAMSGLFAVGCLFLRGGGAVENRYDFPQRSNELSSSKWSADVRYVTQKFYRMIVPHGGAI